MLLVMAYPFMLQAQKEPPSFQVKKNGIYIAFGTSKLHEALSNGTSIVIAGPSIAINMPMIGYQRFWTDRVNTKIAFAAWTPFNSAYGVVGGQIMYWQKDPLLYRPESGTLTNRNKYYYLDFTGGFIFLGTKRSRIEANGGLSYIWGKNTYYLRSPERDYTKTLAMSYLGLIANVNYTYSLWQDRIRPGVFVTGRFYPGLENKQIDLGVQIGYAF